MLLEDLLSLPVGTHVLGEIATPTMVSGVVASRENGSRFIRWVDGYSTIPLGKVREYDEYIAAHTELQPTRRLRAEREAKQHDLGEEASVPDYAAGVSRT